MENGLIVYDGTTETLMSHGDVQEFYLGVSGRRAPELPRCEAVPADAALVGMSMNTRLEIRDVFLHFGEIEALRGVDVDVPSQGITGLIGPNGAGKTALLNTVSGIYRPQSGQVLLDGEDLVGLAPHSVAKAGVGRSFQHLELFPRPLTVTENLLVARDFLFSGNPVSSMVFYGSARRQEMRHRAAVESIIDFFELWPYRDVLAKALPYGVQKLVGFARAMASEPKLLLLDEPGSGLTRDEKEGPRAVPSLRLRDDRKIPILWIEHDLDMVLDLADRIYAPRPRPGDRVRRSRRDPRQCGRGRVLCRLTGRGPIVPTQWEIGR